MYHNSIRYPMEITLSPTTYRGGANMEIFINVSRAFLSPRPASAHFR